MASITINIADNRLAEVLDYIARARNYTGTDRTGNAETKAQFARRMLVEQIHIWVAVGRKMEIEEQINDPAQRLTYGVS